MKKRLSAKERWQYVKSDNARHERATKAKRIWWKRQARLLNPDLPADQELDEHLARQASRKAIKGVGFGLTPHEARRSANWIFLSMQVPDCLEPARCKICGKFYNRPPKQDWKCTACRRAYITRYKANNPDAYKDKHRAAKHNRRAKLRAAGKLSPHAWPMVVAALGNRCLKCGAEDITMDHIVPLALGGQNHVANLQPLCHRCNSIKSATVADYREPEVSAFLNLALDILCHSPH
jgi:5-methylcytosine-specific restriction endonuclease McrA